MSPRSILAVVLGGVIGMILALAGVAASLRGQSPPQATKLEEEVAALRAEVEHLKKVVPDQSHAMKDVDYHFTNLWFAAKAGNWPLADFYWKETLSHLRWAMRIIPVRKDSAGHDVNVQGILEGFEHSPLMEIADSIQAKDPGKFEVKYKLFLEACYACHTSAEKPFLRTQVPEQRATSVINFDPAAAKPH